jgi:hypothetical protein
MIYRTYFKKGYQMQHMQFENEGDLETAVGCAKDYCIRRHLKHIHTLPFLTDLNATDGNDFYMSSKLEEIDISK